MTDGAEPDEPGGVPHPPPPGAPQPGSQPPPPPKPRYDPDAPYPPKPGPGVLPPIPPPFFPQRPDEQPDEPDESAPAPVLPDAAPTPPAPPPLMPTLPDSSPTPPSAPPLFPEQPAVPQPSRAGSRHTDNVRSPTDPAYGGLPTASEATRERAEELREAARKTRQRNRRIGWLVAFVILLVAAAAVAGAVYLFQTEDDGDDDVPTTTLDGEASGAATPLGEQVLTMEAAGEIAGGGLIPSAGAIGAVDQAQAAVDQVNGAGVTGTLPGGAVAITLAELTPEQVMPDVLAVIAEQLEPVDGLARYLVDAASFQQVDPQAYADWIAVLQALPQSPVGDAALPPPGAGQIAIAFATDANGVVSRLVAASADPAVPAVSVQQPG